jgi:hypothetical protein
MLEMNLIPLSAPDDPTNGSLAMLPVQNMPMVDMLQYSEYFYQRAI